VDARLLLWRTIGREDFSLADRLDVLLRPLAHFPHLPRTDGCAESSCHDAHLETDDDADIQSNSSPPNEFRVW
jgi:hypothetical protein